MTTREATGREARSPPQGPPSMLRQFLRLYLVVVFPVIVIVIIVSWLSSEMITMPRFKDQVRASTSTRFGWVRSQLSAVPVDQWKSRIDATRYLYPTGLALDEEADFLGHVQPDPQELARYERGEVAFAPAPPSANAAVIVAQASMTYSFQRVPGTTLVMSSELSFGDPSPLPATLYELLFALIAAAPILWFWFRPFWFDLERLNGVTEQIGSGNFSVQAAPVRSATVKPFAAAIDQMSRRIAVLIDAQRSLTNSVAHELTTPITQLTFAIEMLKDAPYSTQVPHLVEGMTEDLHELESLVAELLEHARLEHTPVFEPERVDLRRLIERAIESAQHAPVRDVIVTHDGSRVDAPLFARCDVHQMNRAVLNLLRNAMRYARSRVTLSAEHRDGRTAIHVDDDGPGIPVVERDRLYEPFARTDASRTRTTGGHGLGLAIVQQVAKLHGGVSRIDTSPLGGARVSIEW